MELKHLVSAYESMTDFCALVATMNGGKILEEEAYTTYFCPDDFWYSRVAFKNRGTATEFANKLQPVLTQMQSHALPPILCYTEQETDAEIEALLKESGFIRLIAQPAMVFEPQQPVTADPHIIQIDHTRLQEWVKTLEAGFEREKTQSTFEAVIGQEHCHFYAYEQQGEILGTTLLCWNGTNGGIHEVAVPPQHCRKGICRALIGKCIEEAGKKELGFLSLQASEEGYPVYRKIGFETGGYIVSWLKLDLAN